GVGADGEHADVVDHDQVGAGDPGDGAGDGVVGAVAADQRAELVDGEPGHRPAGVDGQLAQRLAEVRLPRPAGPADAQVLAPVDPLQGAQGLLGWAWDGAAGLVPGLEGLAGGEV